MTSQRSANQTSEPDGGAVRIVLLAASALVAAILGLALSFLVFGDGGDGRRGGPFNLINHQGAPVDESILKGKLSLVYFGFTYCPDICPTDLAIAVAAREIVQERGGDLQVVFISVDPERDTPSQIADYVEGIGEGVMGLTGAPEQIAKAAKAYGVAYAKSPLTDPDDPFSYEVVHSAYLYAVGPDAREVWRFPSSTPPEVISKRLRTLGVAP